MHKVILPRKINVPVERETGNGTKELLINNNFGKGRCESKLAMGKEEEKVCCRILFMGHKTQSSWNLEQQVINTNLC